MFQNNDCDMQTLMQLIIAFNNGQTGFLTVTEILVYT